MKIKITFFLIVITSICCTITSAQNKTETLHKYLIPYNYFQEHYTKKDSITFKIKDNDTLIEVAKLLRPKGISVPYEPKDSIFLELYKTIAFRTKSDKSEMSHPMKYWKDDIRIYFTKSVSRKVKKALLNFTRKINKDVDSLQITTVNSIKSSNYIIYHNTDFE